MSKEQTHFDLLGVPASFDLDAAQLHRNWLVRQQELHPDRHANLPLPRRSEAMANATTATAEVNQAYKTLSDPLTRAAYLLDLKSAGVDEQETAADGDFLEEMMESQSQISELADSGDEGGLRDALAAIEKRGRAFHDRMLELFADAGYEAADPAHMAQIRQVFNQYKFVRRVLDQGRRRLHPPD